MPGEPEPRARPRPRASRRAPDSDGSSSCSASTPPHSRWYCSARCAGCAARCTGLPSSVKPSAPASRSSAISVSASPARPVRDRGEEADGHARLAPRGLAQRAQDRRASRPPGRCSASRSAATKPPAAAARVPESRSSLCSCPGVRRCTCGSTKPGNRWRPSPSSTSAPSRRRAAGRADLGDLAAADEHVVRRVDPGARVEHVGAADQEVGRGAVADDERRVDRRAVGFGERHHASCGAGVDGAVVGAARPASSS